MGYALCTRRDLGHSCFTAQETGAKGVLPGATPRGQLQSGRSQPLFLGTFHSWEKQVLRVGAPPPVLWGLLGFASTLLCPSLLAVLSGYQASPSQGVTPSGALVLKNLQGSSLPMAQVHLPHTGSQDPLAPLGQPGFQLGTVGVVLPLPSHPAAPGPSPHIPMLSQVSSPGGPSPRLPSTVSLFVEVRCGCDVLLPLPLPPLCQGPVSLSV